MDLFEEKNIKPMLIKEMQNPFNSKDWLYELKLDGIRCIAYLNHEKTELRNKRNLRLLPKFPELKEIYLQVKETCILDGELCVLNNGVPDFYEVQRRALMTDSFKRKLAYTKLPASFVAYDIIYYKNQPVTDKPLLERKNLLESVVNENESLAISRYIIEQGIELYNLAVEKELEGIVAKRLESNYYFGKETRDWIKFKRMTDEDFVVCGFIKKKPISSVILGQYKGNKLIYKGSVSLGVRHDLIQHYEHLITPISPFDLTPINHDTVTWLKPQLVCVVEYMPNTKDALRQPVFKGLRNDVLPKSCISKT